VGYAGFSDKGSVDIASILVGDWIELLAIVSSVDYQIGNVRDGALEVSREFYMHEDSQFPRLADKVFVVRAGFRFTGSIEEMNAQNISMLIGQTLGVGNTNYLYPGVLSAPSYFTLRGRRIRDDSFQMEFAIWKCLQVAAFQLAGGDEAVASPFEAQGLDDSAGSNGGSESIPLGFIYAPSKT